MNAAGLRIAKTLAGCWRPASSSGSTKVDLSDSEIVFFLQSGAGALLWKQMRQQGHKYNECHQAYRLHAMQAVIHEANIVRLVQRLNDAGIDFLLVKGWAVARLYPEPGLRPYGDIDIAVSPDQWQDAANLLLHSEGVFGPVDLHQAIPDLPDRSWPDLWRHRQLVAIGSTSFAIPSPEDQLRHHTLHFLRHGAWRPLWACDIAALLASNSDDFDWDYCLSGKPRLSQWLLAGIGAVIRLFDVPVSKVIVSKCRQAEFDWLSTTILRQWGGHRIGDSHNTDNRPLLSYWRNPAKVISAIADRCPNAIEAAIKAGAFPDTHWPTWNLQLLMMLKRGFSLVRRSLPTVGKRCIPVPGLSVHVPQLR